MRSVYKLGYFYKNIDREVVQAYSHALNFFWEEPLLEQAATPMDFGTCVAMSDHVECDSFWSHAWLGFMASFPIIRSSFIAKLTWGQMENKLVRAEYLVDHLITLDKELEKLKLGV